MSTASHVIRVGQASKWVGDGRFSHTPIRGRTIFSLCLLSLRQDATKEHSQILPMSGKSYKLTKEELNRMLLVPAPNPVVCRTRGGVQDEPIQASLLRTAVQTQEFLDTLHQ